MRLLPATFFLYALFLPSDAHAFDGPRRPVLVLSSGDSLLPAGQLIIKSLREHLDDRAAPGFDVYSEYLDALRFSGSSQNALMMEYLRAKYAGVQFEIVFAIGPEALEFAAEYGSSLFANAPIVFTAVTEQTTDAQSLPANSTGVFSYFSTLGTVELATRLQPDARELYVITGAAAFDKSWEETARQELATYTDRLSVIYLSGLPIPELLRQLAEIPANSIVLYLTIVRDGSGEVQIPADLVPLITDASNAPVYGVYDTYVGRGIIGGRLTLMEAVGKAAANLAVEIMAGTPAAELSPLHIEPPVAVVDWRALERWNLPEDALPPATVVRFRELGLWDRYSIQIVVLVAILLLQSVLIASLLLEQRRRRRVTESLRESEERYRNVVDTQTELICRYLPDTTLTFVNDAYCRYFGRTAAELIGTKFMDLVPAEAKIPTARIVESVLSRRRGSINEHEVLRADGSIGWQQWIDHVVVDNRGEIVEIQGIGRDITDLKIAENEVKVRRQELAHLTRVAILGELSGAMAHELNQPLTAILSNAEAAQHLLQHSTPDMAEVRAAIADIIDDDKRAGAVINRLRELLRKGQANFRPLQLNELALDASKLVKSELIARNVTLQLSLSPDPTTILGDSVQLEQVMLNLLLNACDAMAGNSADIRTIVLSTESRTDGWVAASVADDGAGMTSEQLDRLFEPFFSTKENGLGLGLSICQSIVVAHGGRLTATNNPQRGATFTMALPGNLGEAA